jgi:ABC-type transporter MlaC component
VFDKLGEWTQTISGNKQDSDLQLVRYAEKFDKKLELMYTDFMSKVEGELMRRHRMRQDMEEQFKVVGQEMSELKSRFVKHDATFGSINKRVTLLSDFASL